MLILILASMRGKTELSSDNNKHPKTVSNYFKVEVRQLGKPVTLSQQVILGHGLEHHFIGNKVTGNDSGFSKGFLLSKVGCYAYIPIWSKVQLLWRLSPGQR